MKETTLAATSDTVAESATLYMTPPHEGSSVESILELITQLRVVEKLELMESLLAMVRNEIAETSETRSLYGLFQGISVSEEDIAEARREMLHNFPRDDIFIPSDKN